MQKNNSMPYRKDIDGIRALAVLFVLVYHFDLLAFGKGGFLGVDVFFVISGFLITSIIKNQLDNDTFSFSNFYIRRIKRLAPALFIVLLLVSIIGWFVLLPIDFVELIKQIFTTQFYFSNIFYWKTINYFGLGADSVFLLHTWSLAVEEQFYLVFPIFLFAIHRYANKYFWQILIITTTISFGLNIFFLEIKREATFYLMPTRAWELLAGSLVIPLIVKFKFKNSFIYELLAWIGLFLILFGVLFYKAEIRTPGFFSFFPVIGTCLLLYTGNQNYTIVSRLLSLKWIVFIGNISYSLYLIHWPVNVFAEYFFGDQYSLLWRFLMFCLSIFGSALLYYTLENPIRKNIFIKQNKRIIISYSAGMAITILICSTIYVTDGFPSRFPNEVVKMAGFVNDNATSMRKCEYLDKKSIKNPEFCTIGNEQQESNWLLYGDSHAWAIANAFDIWLEKRNEAGLFMFKNSCPPIKDVYLFNSRKECHKFNSYMLEYILAHTQIKNIVLASTWVQAREGIITDYSNKKLSHQESIKLFDDKFIQTVKLLESHNKNVYIWEPVPGANGNVPKKLALSLLTGNKHRGLEISLNDYLRTTDFFFKTLNKGRQYIKGTFSPSEALCATGMCKVVINNLPVYSDRSHLTNSLAEFWASTLEKQYNTKINSLVIEYNN